MIAGSNLYPVEIRGTGPGTLSQAFRPETSENQRPFQEFPDETLGKNIYRLLTQTVLPIRDRHLSAIEQRTILYGFKNR